MTECAIKLKVTERVPAAGDMITTTCSKSGPHRPPEHLEEVEQAEVIACKTCENNMAEGCAVDEYFLTTIVC